MIIYVTGGSWGPGTGTPNSAAQIDGNFYDLDQRVVALADLEGKGIESVTYTSSSMTLHFTDGTSQVIPLPVATMTFVGEWLNSMPLNRGNIFSFRGLGIFQVLVDHVTPAAPAPFDPNATDGDGNPLYALWMPLRDVNYDAAIFVPGSIQRTAGELLFQGIANRTMILPAGNERAFAYLATSNAGTTAVILSIEVEGSEVGTITFAAGALSSPSGQNGAFSIPTDAPVAEGNSYALRVTQSDDPQPADLSVTLPFLRTDI